MNHAQAVIGQKIGNDRRECPGELQVVKTYEADPEKVPRPAKRLTQIVKCARCGAELSLSYGWEDDAHDVDWALYPSRPSPINNDFPGGVEL